MAAPSDSRLLQSMIDQSRAQRDTVTVLMDLLTKVHSDGAIREKADGISDSLHLIEASLELLPDLYRECYEGPAGPLPDDHLLVRRFNHVCEGVRRLHRGVAKMCGELIAAHRAMMEKHKAGLGPPEQDRLQGLLAGVATTQAFADSFGGQGRKGKN